MSLADRATLFGAAQTAHAQGRLAESQNLFEQILHQNPGDLEAQLYLGMVKAKRGDDAGAAALFEKVLAVQPNCFEALFWLSILYRKSSRTSEAIELASSALAIQPNSPHALNNLGLCQMAEGRYSEAASIFARSVHSRAGDPTTLYNLATCLGLIGDDEAALRTLTEASRIAPNSPDIRVLTAQTHLNLNQLEAAVKQAETGLKLNPRSASGHRILGLALMHLGRATDAERQIRGALTLEPNDSSSLATLGSILQSLGEIENSSHAFQESIDRNPNQGHAYLGLIQNRRSTDSERPLLQRIESLVESGNLPPKELSSLRYAAGKAYEELGDYAKSFAHYDEANRISRRLKFGENGFDRISFRRETDLKIARYDKPFFDSMAQGGTACNTPIFIVGMMRSGTTLVEQILSTHPRVTAGGEQEFWLRNGLRSLNPDGTPNPGKLKKIADEYENLLRHLGDSAFVTDKMPANYLMLGLIHAAFPKARIVHIRRNPADTAISIWATPNRARIEYAHDKSAIVFAYREYERLMRHWRTVLPSQNLLDLEYESLVGDPETNSRRLCDFLELEWDEAMLAPELSRRAVVTPSVNQVRQPVYRTSIARWQKFEPWLGEFGELLGSGE